MTLYARLANRFAKLSSTVRAAHARLTGVELDQPYLIESGCTLALGSTPARQGRVALGPRSHLSKGVVLSPWGGSIVLGENVFVGPYTVIYGHGGVVIGKDTLISMHCRILSSNHSMPPDGTIIRSQPDEALPTRIGEDVWLGAGVTVLGGVTIGNGCVVGAGAVVTQDLPPRSISVGVPATVRGLRA